MNPLATQISGSGLYERVFDETQLARLLGGSDARRYALVNRALKDGSLLRLKRSTYMMAQQGRNEAIHPFAAAQALVPGSYISLETALAYYGWIPEAVHTISSITPGRKTLRYEVPTLGQFTFHPLATQDYWFLTGVKREKFGKLTAFVAEPLRALMDLVVLRKEHWSGLEWFTKGMRIDEALLFTLRHEDFLSIRRVYKHKAANSFLQAFENAVLAASKGHTESYDHD